MPNNSIKISIHDGTVNVVDESTKSAVYKAVKKINSTFSPEVFNNINIHITSDFSNLPKSSSALTDYLKENESSYSATRGITTDDYERKEIFIQESAFWTNKLLNIFSKFSFSANDEIEQATLHEFGHQFDYLGGNEMLMQKHQELVNKYYNVQFEEFQLLPEEEKITSYTNIPYKTLNEWATKNNIEIEAEYEYSDEIVKGNILDVEYGCIVHQVNCFGSTFNVTVAV